MKLSFFATFFAVLAAFAQTLPSPAVFPLEFPSIDSPILYGLLNTSLLRSDDRGATWTPLYVAPQGATQNVNRLIVHPDRPQIVYARLARANGGLFRSQDGGRTWTPFTTGLPATGEILDPVILRGAGESARLRIADILYTLDPTASSWTRLADLPANTTVLAFDLANPQRAAVLARSGTFYFSANAGQSWELRSRIMQDPRKFGRQILFDPKSDTTLFVRAEAESDQNGRCDAPGGGLWRSGDTGRTFVNVYTSNLCNVSPATFIDPNRPNVYLRTGFAGQPYCRSIDRGATFVCTQEPVSTNPPYLVAMDPRNGDLYRERFSLISRDGATTWQPATSSFRPTLRIFPETAATVAQGETTNITIALGLAEGSFAIPYQATTSGEPWLSLGAASGNLNTPLSVRISAADLVPGTYRASLLLTSSLTVNPSTTIPLVVTVTPQAFSAVRYSFERLAGGPGGLNASIVEGASALAQPLNSIAGAARDSQGNLYVMTNRRLRRISPDGAIQTIAGNGQQGTTPDNTPAAQARFNSVDGVAVAGDGTIYVADSTPSRIYAITGGVVRVVADETFITVPGSFPSRLGSPRGIGTSPQGDVFVNDGVALLRLNGVQRPEVAFVLRNFTAPVGSPSLFDLFVESNTSFLFSSGVNHRIYRLAGGRLTVLAGTGTAGRSGDGGPALAANLNRPTALAPDGEGNILFFDSGNSVLRLIRPDGTLFTVSSSSFANSSLNANAGTVRDTRFGIVAAILPAPANGFVVLDSAGAFSFTRQAVEAPEIQSGAAVNAGSFTNQLSPGSLFSLYGAHLAFDTQAASSTPLPTRLAGAEVLLNGQPIPLAFASPGQVNAQIPPATPVGPARLQARVDGNLSGEIIITLSSAAPGIFVYGDNRAVVQNQDGGINGPDSPELPGRFAVLYLTGIGATTATVAPGAPSPADPLAFAVNGATLQVGDAPANVLFTGLTPGFVGLAQINFQVPELAAGDYPLTVTIDGVPSNSPLLRIGTP